MYLHAENILKAHRGTRFLKADLHVHTPASKDWDEKNPEPEFHSSKITPQQIVDAALSEELEVIAITDHNSVGWCQRVIDAAKGTLLTVLPGFELTVDPGVHILAIFEENERISDLEDLLINLDIERDDFGYASAMTNASITNHPDGDYQIIRKIQDAGGLVIPAHIDNDSGIVGRLKGGPSTKEFLLNSGCRILEITKDDPPEIVLDILKHNPRQFALIRNSDAHRLDRIGANPTWVKLDLEPDRNLKPKYLDSLKQIGLEPLSRVQRTSSDPIKKPQIIGMYSNGGMLKEQHFAFNEDLNCIIGGRGAGKSTLLDYLRFVLGDEPDSDELKGKLRKRYVDLIGHSTTVHVLIEDSSDDLWLYERTLEFETRKEKGKEKIQINSAPPTIYQVFRDTSDLVKFGEDTNKFSVDFYSQGEVQSITNNAETSRQLKLVDNYIRINLLPREQKIIELQDTLEAMEIRISKIADDLETLNTEIKQINAVKTRIAEIEKSLDNDELIAHQVWEDANGWIASAIDHLEKQIIRLDEMEFENFDSRKFALPETKSQKIYDTFHSEFQSVLAFLISTGTILKEQIKESKKKVDDAKTNWDSRFLEQKRRYEKLLREQGAANLAVLNTELTKKRLLRDRIIEKTIPKYNELKQEYEKLCRKRVKKLKKLLQEWESIRESRKLAATRMTERLGNEIKLEISEEVEINDYHDLLDEISPSGTHTKSIETVTNYFSPTELAQAIRAKDINKLQESGLPSSEKAARKFLNITESDLMKLERVKCEDIATIQLKIEGKYKDLSSLSDGEKCTAILSIVLLDENRPLVIDQPEDELDHDFIMSNVVNTIADVKQKNDVTDKKFQPRTGRQFIIATHNQNIPVLGSAELVIRMKKVPDIDRCEIVTAYGIEHPESIKQVLNLEGGKEAFERRREKYLSSLHD